MRDSIPSHFSDQDQGLRLFDQDIHLQWRTRLLLAFSYRNKDISRNNVLRAISIYQLIAFGLESWRIATIT